MITAALISFVVVFVAQIVVAVRRGATAYEAARQLPLEKDDV
jgi:hypothetical protein